MSNTIVIASPSPRPRTPSPRTTAQSSQSLFETLNSSEYTTPTPMPIRSMTLAQLYHSSRRSRHDSPQHKITSDSDVVSISSSIELEPLQLFEYSSACNDQEKLWKETNADDGLSVAL